MATDDVHEMFAEMRDKLAEETGVDAGDVDKILAKLGLTEALQHAASADDVEGFMFMDSGPVLRAAESKPTSPSTAGQVRKVALSSLGLRNVRLVVMPSPPI